MTPDDTKLKELLDRIQSLPEDAELPDDFFEDLTQEEIVAIYVEKMIADKGVEPTDELRMELRTKLSDEITKQMVLAMPDYLVAKLNEEMENGADEEVVNKLIDESGIDVETITEQTMNNFRDNYLNGEEK
jgi:hypothetical protein